MKNFIKKSLDKISWLKSNISQQKWIFVVYILIVFLSATLLYSPITQNLTNGNKRVSFIDAIFTTASSFSDTGILTVQTYSQWNEFGQAIIALLFLLGGIGVFSLKLFLINWLFRKKSISLNEINLVNSERGSHNVSQTTRLVIVSLKFLLSTIVVFSFILTLYFYFAEPSQTEGMKQYFNDKGITFNNPHNDFLLSLKFGIFHSISAINNAGFDIIGPNSLMPYYLNFSIQIMFIILFLLGGLGYPTIYDIRKFIFHKIKRKKGKYNFTIFTKISVFTYLITAIIGFLITFLFEYFAKDPNTFWNYTYNGKSFYGDDLDKTFAIFFNILSTRSAGFATVNFNHFTSANTIIYSIFMFIGAAPASTGGGIRTTTFAIIILSVVTKMIGLPNIRIFKRSIPNETIYRSSQVFVISILLVFIITLICMTSSPAYNTTEMSNYNDFSNYLFVVSSAFGTCGLSSGIDVNQFNIASKISLIILMFIGQFGISSTLLLWGRKRNYKNHFNYIESDVAIG